MTMIAEDIFGPGDRVGSLVKRVLTSGPDLFFRAINEDVERITREVGTRPSFVPIAAGDLDITITGRLSLATSPASTTGRKQ